MEVFFIGFSLLLLWFMICNWRESRFISKRMDNHWDNWMKVRETRTTVNILLLTSLNYMTFHNPERLFDEQ